MFNVVYIIDILLFSTNIDLLIDNIIQNLWDRFQMTELGDVSYYLRIIVDVNFNKKTISLWQSILLKEILGQYNINICRPANISISSRITNFFIIYKDKIRKSVVDCYQLAMETLI